MDDSRSEILGLSEDAFHKVAGYATLAGLCPLIPIPFVDDVIIDRIRLQIYHSICSVYGIKITAKDARYLTARTPFRLDEILKTVVWWPVKRIIRKVAYFLSIKSCADVAATVFHEGWLFARAIEQGYVDREAMASGDHETLRDLRKALMFAHDEINPDVTRQSMRVVFGASREVVASLVDQMKGSFQKKNVEEVNLEAAEAKTAPLRDRIEAELRAHWPLEDKLDDALRRGYASIT